MPQTNDTLELAMREAERHGRGDAEAGAKMRTSDACSRSSITPMPARCLGRP